jgi:hypothetical protein
MKGAHAAGERGASRRAAKSLPRVSVARRDARFARLSVRARLARLARPVPARLGAPRL